MGVDALVFIFNKLRGGGLSAMQRSIGIQRLHRANSFIGHRKESAARALKQEDMLLWGRLNIAAKPGRRFLNDP
jgi:hypothetical protein